MIGEGQHQEAVAILSGVCLNCSAMEKERHQATIESGKVSADRGLVILVTVMVALLSGAMIALVLLTAEQP